MGHACSVVQEQPVSLRVVGENLCVSAPIQCGIELMLNVFLGEVFIQDVAKEAKGNRPV
jgi:hypothetical protein